MSLIVWIGLLLQIATLSVLIYYAGRTAAIAREAVKQAENLILPVLELRAAPNESEDVLFEEIVYEVLPAEIAFENIGSGPALNPTFSIVDRSKGKTTYTERLAAFAKGETRKSVWRSPGAFPRKTQVVLLYESASGIRYETRTDVEEEKILGSVFSKLG